MCLYVDMFMYVFYDVFIYLPIFSPMVPNVAAVSYTSNIPQTDVGKYLGLS